MKTIGLLGGLSAESSLEYYRILNKAAQDKFGGCHSARCILQSLNFGEIERLLRTGEHDAIGEIMVDAARDLERGGAEMIIICSNTCHIWAEVLSESVTIPLFSIIDVVADAVKRKSIRRVGLIGTRATMEGDFYRNRLMGHGLDVVTPAEEDRIVIDRIIFGELVEGVIREESRLEYCRIIEKLAQAGAEGVILGCTEIELLIPPAQVGEMVSTSLFATTQLHAEAAFSWSIGERELLAMPGAIDRRALAFEAFAPAGA